MVGPEKLATPLVMVLYPNGNNLTSCFCGSLNCPWAGFVSGRDTIYLPRTGIFPVSDEAGIFIFVKIIFKLHEMVFFSVRSINMSYL